jgi:hypothetical protein
LLHALQLVQAVLVELADAFATAPGAGRLRPGQGAGRGAHGHDRRRLAGQAATRTLAALPVGEASARGLAECATTTPEATTALRDHSVRLFADLVRHHKRGLDLVYEAYHVDIGGES